MNAMIQVSELSKTYKGGVQTTQFREALVSGIRGLFGKRAQDTGNRLAALHDVNFELDAGDVLGIVGNNGAGKTTLLKILAGIIKPTTGNVFYKGKLLSILDFGTGFHPDLTGRQNIYLSGSMLGLTKAEIRSQYDALVAFSELGSEVNKPVKHYSNGMYLRLAFSVFSHLRSDILLLDEVVSVGDFGFRQKCQERISWLAKTGTTILLVSHYADQVRYLCNKCLWLDKGEMKAFGNTEKVMEQYLTQYRFIGNDKANHAQVWPEGYLIDKEVMLLRYELRTPNNNKPEALTMNDDLEIEIEFEKLHNGPEATLAFAISSVYNAWVFVESFGLYTEFEKRVSDRGRYICSCRLPGGILNFGTYHLGLMVSVADQLVYQQPSIFQFTIHFKEREGVKSHLAQGSKSIMQPKGSWKVHRVG